MKDNDEIEFLSFDEEPSKKVRTNEEKKAKENKKPLTRTSKYENLLEENNKKQSKKDKDMDKKQKEKENKNIEGENKEVDEANMKKRSKRRKLKKGIGQTIFCLISFLFMIGCFIFYGSRAIHYYKIYNPKGSDTEPLATSIMKKASVVYEGAGIYKEAGNYLYKGEKVDNYLRFANLTWRIVKIANDNTIEIVLDDPINIMAFDSNSSDFNKSDVSTYLNKEFVKYLDTSKLDKAVVCEDAISDLTKLSCNDSSVSNYVKLPDISAFLNSIAEDTYMADDNDTMWLYNKKNNKEVWYTSGYNISSTKPTEFNSIKPVVTLKSTNVLLGGKGTKEDPYRIEKEKNKLKLGSYVTIDEDTWIVYKEEKNALRLTLSELNTSVRTRQFSTNSNLYDPKDTGSIASYLNTYYYEDIDYKDILLESNWYTGEYKTSYKDIYSSEVKAYVGMLNAADFKFGSFSDYYYLTTPASDNLIYIYANSLLESDTKSYEYYRPAITIANNVKIKSGSGTANDPFVLEV